MFLLWKQLDSWFRKKQNGVSLSTVQAEYSATGSSCMRLLWMKQMLVEYDFSQDVLTLYCDNMIAIHISKNPVQHSKIKYIDIWHNFVRELLEEKKINLEHVHTEK